MKNVVMVSPLNYLIRPCPLFSLNGHGSQVHKGDRMAGVLTCGM